MIILYVIIYINNLTFYFLLCDVGFNGLNLCEYLLKFDL